MYYVYIIRSLKDSSNYIGFSSNLRKRVAEHNLGKNVSTRSKTPYKLIFYEAFINKVDALNREKYLKSGYGNKTIKSLLNNYFNFNS